MQEVMVLMELMVLDNDIHIDKDRRAGGRAGGWVGMQMGGDVGR